MFDAIEDEFDYNLDSDFLFINTIFNFISLHLFTSPIEANRTYSIKVCTNIITMLHPDLFSSDFLSFYFDSFRMANEFQIDQLCEFFLVANNSFHFDREISTSFIQVLFESLHRFPNFSLLDNKYCYKVIFELVNELSDIL